MIERKKIIIDDEFIKNFKGKCFPLGLADHHGTKITLHEFFPKDKNNKDQVELAEKMNSAFQEQGVEEHEKQHLHNSMVPILEWANSLNEVLLMSFLNEVSAALTGNLQNKTLNAENVFKGVMNAVKSSLGKEYIDRLYPSIADKWLTKNSDKVLNTEIRPDIIKKAMRCYFYINGKGDVVKLLDESQMMQFNTEYLRAKNKLDMLAQNKRADYFLSKRRKNDSPELG